MSVILTSPVEGKDVGETYSGEREDWLVANGYAARPGATDGLHMSDVDAKDDPTLAANREAPVEDGPDGYLRQDGKQVLAVKKVESIENLGPAFVKHAGLEGSHPTRHGEGAGFGDDTRIGEDKLSKKIQKGSEELQAKRAEDPLLDGVPQADARGAGNDQEGMLAKIDEADKASEKASERSHKLREHATESPRIDIPADEINVEKAKAEKKAKADK